MTGVSSNIAIIDYNVGNLGSVQKAFEFIGYKAEITSEPERVAKADAVVLPGVGAFEEGMACLEKAGMLKAVKEAAAGEKPFLGICLGMQLLFDYSEEGRQPVKGLGILRGAIKQIPTDLGLKVPHMGWNLIKAQNDCVLFKNLPVNPYVYFVHSYYLEAEDKAIVSATAEYGVTIGAAVSKGKLCATQFHPEKSGEAGLAMLRNWAAGI